MKMCFLFALVGMMCCGLVRAQATYDAEAISRVVLWETYSERPLELTCISPLGNRADLAAFVNLAFHYPQYCVDMYAEGRMLYEAYLNPNGDLDSLVLRRSIPGCEEKGVEEQLRAAFSKLRKIDETGSCKRFILEIRIAIAPRPLIPTRDVPK